MSARVNILTALRGDITYLKTSYCTQPFKIADITEDKKAGTLHLVLMNSSPGILDGDEYKIKVDVSAGCSLKLMTQSYQRLFTMKKTASQFMEVNIGVGSSFHFIPHPAVPHETSSFYAGNKIFLADDCRLIWGEVLTCGRKLSKGVSGSGEIFRFLKYHNLTQVYLNNKLVIKENLLMEPSRINVNDLGQLEGYTHQATMIYLENGIADDAIKNIHTYLEMQKGIAFGVTPAPINGLIVRLLGQKAEQLFDCLKRISDLAGSAAKKFQYAD